MRLLQLKNISLHYGSHHLLDQVNLELYAGEKLALLGRNGEGKSSLLKLIAGETKPDAGEVIGQQQLKIAFLSQEVPINVTGSVLHVVAMGLGQLGQWLEQYQELSAHAADPAITDKIHRLQQQIEDHDGWNIYKKCEAIMSRMQLNPAAKIESLSGGLKRRVLLAQALVSEPDILLLDEPTNHLDIAAILWLENFLANYQGALLVVTHDRAFMQKISQRILELDRGKIYSYQGDYKNYLRYREQRLQAEETANALFDKRLAQEEVWIRQGIKARRTRNEGRVRALKNMRMQRTKRRMQQGTVKINPLAITASSDKVFEIDNVSFAYSEQPIVSNFSSIILRGDKIGIVGPNGCGKTTLLQLILGELTPTQGQIILGNRLQIAYFDQLRSQLDDKETVLENFAEGREQITINGKTKHVMGYLQDFLFSPSQVYSKVAQLSGGERNRLLLAKLFSKPANVLVMDEPTNDLDIETLELLEALLVEYSGTLLIISHDREFLNNVVTSLYVYEGSGCFNEYVGGYDDYITQKAKEPVKSEPVSIKTPAISTPTQITNKRKLSFNEQRELQQLPVKIENLEQEIAGLHNKMLTSEFYQQTENDIIAFKLQLKQLEEELSKAYSRWEQLEP